MEKNVLGIVVGRNTHTLLRQKEGEFIESYIPNSREGLEKVAEEIINLKPSKIVFAGNKNWFLPLAYNLREKFGEEQIFYLSFKTDPNQRGKIGKISKLLRSSFVKGNYGRSFFDQKNLHIGPVLAEKEKEPTAEIYRLAKEYHGAGEEVRRAKHFALNHLSLLFPEAVRVSQTGKRAKEDLPIPQPQPRWNIWTKKMRPVLENPMVEELEQQEGIPSEIRTLAKESIARSVPLEIRQRELENLQKDLSHLDEWEKRKKRTMEKLKELVKEYPLVQDFGGGDLICVLAGLLCWRRSWPIWRELRSYAGLAVTRVDGKGKPRISRKRPAVTSTLYLIGNLTTMGKEVSRNIGEGVEDEEEKRRKLRRVKRIERLLKYIWKFYLRKETNPKT